MEAKINIAEILKDKPQGTKLWSSVSNDECELQEITEDSIAVGMNDVGRIWLFSVYGTTFSFPKGGVLLFPSKEMPDWSKFSWKKGDVLVHKDGDVHIIFERFVDDTYCSFVGKYYLWKENNNTEQFYENERLLTSDFQKAGKDAAQTYISTIEERLGGKLNRETLEIEKTQPEFKDGDIAFADFGKTQDVFIVSGKTNLSEGYYSFIALNLNSTKDLSIGYKTSFFKENLNTLRLATEEEKQQLFDALAKEGKAWDAEKKAIVDLPKKCEFKPMDWCLMRDIRGEECFAWSLCQFAYQLESGRYEAVGGMRFDECIPYNESTKHLLGTTGEWKGGEQ